jgi:hypothetical protein
MWAGWLCLALAGGGVVAACVTEPRPVPSPVAGAQPRSAPLGPRAQAPPPAPSPPATSVAAVPGDDQGLLLGLVQRSGDLILRRDPVRTNATNYADLAYACIGLFEGAHKLRILDPARADRFEGYARLVADHLVQQKDMTRDGRTGWGLDYAYTDQGTRVTIPAHQEYAFQTGIAGYCLLGAYEATRDAQYLKTAEEAVATFWNVRTTRVDPRCADCAYFWYSTHPNYTGRYIKNTNVLMGMLVARLAQVTGDPRYRAAAVQVFNAERYEIDERRNFNYLGAHDPRFAPNPEKHLGPEMWAFDRMTRHLGVPAPATLAKMIDFFWRCGDRCAANVAQVPGILAGCGLTHYGEPSRTRCQESIRRYSPPNQAQMVDDVALIGVVNALGPP